MFPSLVMSLIQLIYGSGILLTILVSNEIPLTQGRQLKSAGMLGSHAIKLTLHIEVPNHGDDASAPHAATAPSPAHSAAEHHSLEFSDSVAGYADGFRPTAPGNSPSIGYAFTGHKDEVQRNFQSDGTAVNPPPMASVQDHSPGVGHITAVDSPPMTSIQDHSPSVGHAREYTVEGHSPGVGHSFQDSKAERKP